MSSKQLQTEHTSRSYIFVSNTCVCPKWPQIPTLPRKGYTITVLREGAKCSVNIVIRATRASKLLTYKKKGQIKMN